MTWTKSVTLWCECGEWARIETEVVGAARSTASRQEGWTFRKGIDRCRSCATNKRRLPDDDDRTEVVCGTD
jgi:hypothetical protein